MSVADLEERIRRGYLDALDRPDDARVVIDELLRREAPLLQGDEAESMARRIASRVKGLGAIDQFWDDDTVSDILINGPGPVWVERRGVLEVTDVRVDRAEIDLIIERTLTRSGVRVDRGRPVADGRLADGSRISVVLPPIAVDGPLVSIRRFAVRSIGLDAFAGREVVAVLESLVARRANVVVYGRTGCGKTTFLNALGTLLATSDRVLTVEDAAELRLGGPHIVRLEARVANADGAGETSIRELVRAALRLRPDRIVVGEVRGPEALDMVWAMSSGHDGSMSTVHASSAVDALLRLETFISMGSIDLPTAAVRAQVASAIDVLVGLDRLEGGARRLVAIDEVAPLDRPFGVRPIVVGDQVIAELARAPRTRGHS